jgi:Immunity protein 26
MPSRDSKQSERLTSLYTKGPKRDWSRPGTWFAVTLPGGGYGVALVARRRPSTRRYKEIFVYIFCPQFGTVEEIGDVQRFKAGDQIALTFTYDQGMLDGKWPIIGRMEPFNAEGWPLPLIKSGPFGGGPDWKRRFEIYRMGDDLQLEATLGTMILDDPSKYIEQRSRGYLSFEAFVEDALSQHAMSGPDINDPPPSRT